MTLIDSDMNNIDRGTPMPNTHDVLSASSVGAKATQGNQYSVNALPSGRINVTNQRIITNDGTSNRILITPTQMLVSQTGVDVTTATNSQLIFNSNQDIFKIVSTIPSFTLSGTYSHGTGVQNTIIASTSIYHGLGFVPAVQVFSLNSSTGRYQPASDGSLSLDSVGIGFSSTYNFAFIRNFSVDSNYFYAEIDYKAFLSTGTTSGNWSESYKVYLLQETAN